MNVWVEAARPRTLPASAAPVLVGTAAGASAGGLVGWRFLLALLVAVSVQVAVNYANDYFDGVRGVDTVQRAGPRRAVASGLVSPPAMLTAVFVAIAVAAADRLGNSCSPQRKPFSSTTTSILRPLHCRVRQAPMPRCRPSGCVAPERASILRVSPSSPP